MDGWAEWVFNWDDWCRWDARSVGGYEDLPPELQGARTAPASASFTVVMGQRVRPPAEWDEGVED